MKKLILCMSLMCVFSGFASVRENKKSSAWGIEECEKFGRVEKIVDDFEDRVVKEYGPYYCAAARKLVQGKWVLENLFWGPYYSKDLTQENLPFVRTLLALYKQGPLQYYYRLQAGGYVLDLSQRAEMLLKLADSGALRLKHRKYRNLDWFVTIGRYQAFAMVKNVTG
jgi:hypothetical protein